MNTKKFLSTIISFIIILSPISNAVRPSCNIFKEQPCKLHVEDYHKQNKKPLSEVNNLKQLISYIKNDIKNSENINEIKNKYYKHFEQCIFKNEKDSDQIYDIFILFFSYVIVELIAKEIDNKKIDFSLLKNLLQYLHSEDMHFLFHAYIVANSDSLFSSSQIYINHAIASLAKKGKEKSINNAEDLIHKIIRKNLNDKNVLKALKNMYDEHLLSFKSFYENNSDNLTPLQRNIMTILVGSIFLYKIRNITKDPIDLYNNYFKEAYPTATPR